MTETRDWYARRRAWLLNQLDLTEFKIRELDDAEAAEQRPDDEPYEALGFDLSGAGSAWAGEPQTDDSDAADGPTEVNQSIPPESGNDPLEVTYTVYGRSDSSKEVTAIGFNIDSAGSAWFILSQKPGDVLVYAAGVWTLVEGE